jgi:hypothetical protein
VKEFLLGAVDGGFVSHYRMSLFAHVRSFEDGDLSDFVPVLEFVGWSK